MTKSYTKAAMIYIGEMYGKWRSPQGDICYHFYRFLLPKMNSTKNFDPEKGITCHIP